MKIEEVICITCGEVYDLTDLAFEGVPLEFCGECGGEYFIRKSEYATKGFRSAEHYFLFMDMLPSHLRNKAPMFLNKMNMIYDSFKNK